MEWKGKPPCKLRKGLGTDHLGFGQCKHHGGSLEQPSKAAHREAAISFAKGALGAEVAIGPLDALLQAVRLAAGHVYYWRVRMLNDDHSEGTIAGLERAIRLMKECSKAALDSKIDERLVRVAERFADVVTLSVEEAWAKTPGLTNEQRTIFARELGLSLARHEAHPVIDGQARELPAAA